MPGRRTGHHERVRFQVTRALDAIELRLSTDPILTGAVIDLTEAVRTPGPDGRPANLLRVGLVIDALSRQLVDESVALYAVASRSLLSDTDLTSNERMVLRRWSDDGLIELLPQGSDPLARACEVGHLLGQPVITVRAVPGFTGARLTPVPASGGLTFVPGGDPATSGVVGALSRLWRCAASGCPSFPAVPSQPPPTLAPNGVPICPRHLERLSDIGARPAAVGMTLRVEGLARYRFAVTAASPMVAGRAPDGPNAVVFGPYLNERIAPRISRSHLRLELREGTVVATDISTNGSVLRTRGDGRAKPRLEKMVRDRPYPVADWDAVELAEGVEIGRANRQTGAAPNPAQPSSVMRDAPTIAMRLPPMR